MLPQDIRETYKSFTKRERRILIAIVAVPVLAALLSRLFSLFISFALQDLDYNSFTGELLFWMRDTVPTLIPFVFFTVLLIVCSVTKKWKLLWPLLVYFGGAPLIFELLASFEIAAYAFDWFDTRILRFFISCLFTLVHFARYAFLWLTVLYVYRYFKARQIQQNNLEETLS